ncbi:porin [Paucibacter sp. XJ19-41]|uniref:porin n=1 Tax=Paucibacter sp. XJ19-41 TaxID=2927824 RepID=UPI00234B535D|nr:porin [Paucibacter sp. XJ19-41]MDC6166045.1 porin [Paucibacter sp. XJ19-41]
MAPTTAASKSACVTPSDSALAQASLWIQRNRPSGRFFYACSNSVKYACRTSDRVIACGSVATNRCLPRRLRLRIRAQEFFKQETLMSKKKTFLVLGLLAGSVSAAWAQSSVTVYGILDGGVSYTSGIAGGARKQVVSGIMDGSRLGFRGNEDIGGGYRALFVLENRLELDTGTNSNTPVSGTTFLPDRWGKQSAIFTPTNFGLPGVPPAVVAGATAGWNSALQAVTTALGGRLAANSFGVNIGNARFWDRQAYVGLVTPFGAVLAGRQYTPAYELNAAFDTMATQSSLAAGQVAAVPAVIDIRQSNALQYRIQQGGLSASVMVAAGEGSTSQGRFYGAMVQYKTDAYGVGVGMNAKDNELGQRSLRSITLGASAKVGPGTVSFLYNDISDPNPSGLSALLDGLRSELTGRVIPMFTAGINQQAAGLGNLLASRINVDGLVNDYKSAFVQDAAAFSIGYRMTMGQHTFYTAFNRLDDKTRINADTDSYGVAYSYALSKRTDLNFVLTHFDNKGMGQAAPGQAGFLGGFTSAPGVDSNNVAMGIRHRF